jgi:hypothetical protein
MPVHRTLNTQNIRTNTNTFIIFLPTSTLTTHAPTKLTTHFFNNGMLVHQIIHTQNIRTNTNTFNNKF